MPFYLNIDFFIIMPEFFLCCCSLFLLVFFSYYSTTKRLDFGGVVPVIVEGSLFIGILALFFCFCLVINNPIIVSPLFFGYFFYDYIGHVGKLGTLLFSIFCMVVSINYIKRNKVYNFEYSILVLFSIISIMLLICSTDFIGTYLMVELQALAFYILASLKKKSSFSAEAGLKYFILGAFSSGILLFGFSCVYGCTATTNYGELQIILSSSVPLDFYFILVIGLLFISVAFLFKLSAAPFHIWAPDVYEGSPTIVSIFFSVVPKLSLLIAFSRICFFPFYTMHIYWQAIIGFSAIISLLVGSISALFQKKIKRFLVFSSISHLGYILIVLSSITLAGIQAALLYIFIYMAISVCAWLLVSSIEDGKGSSARYLVDFSYISKKNSVVGISTVLLLFSMGGVPPLAGFGAKFFSFLVLMELHYYFLSFFTVVMATISCFYYLKLIKICYFENLFHNESINSRVKINFKISHAESYILGMLIFIIFFFFIFPNFFLLLVHKISLSFLF